jgi:hypothetical protein
MNRIPAVLALLTAAALALYAEAPELRNVMPNSWRKVTRLTAEEERQFMAENGDAMARLRVNLAGINTGFDLRPGLDYIFMCKQQIGTEIFYRLLCTDHENPDFLSPAIWFWQFLIYRNRLLLEGRYNYTYHTQRSSYCDFHSIDIISSGDTAKGVLRTNVTVQHENDDDTRWSENAYIRGQLRGFGFGGSYYMLMKDIEKNLNSNDTDYIAKNCPFIEISASSCLVDPNMPLRYSLQNAFDGDPATSYVENTEDDLMKIQLSLNPFQVQRFAIINGYAQNMTLYKKNNRIKQIDAYEVNWALINEANNVDITAHILSDNMLAYQFIDIDNYELWVEDVYTGSDYADTCLAEFNLYIDGLGWLFGDIDE